MSNTNRAIINHYFQEASAIELPRGHPTIALNSEQVQSILRVVADESVRASYAMMEDIIERARRLSLSNLPTRRPDQRDISEGGSAPTSDAETYSDRETDRAGSFTSGALRIDDDSNSIGYSYERHYRRWLMLLNLHRDVSLCKRTWRLPSHSNLRTAQGRKLWPP